MKRHLVRHFPAKDIKFCPNENYADANTRVTIPNDFRHLDLEKAEEWARKFREKFAQEGHHCVLLRGHSNALRTKYTLLLATIGLCEYGPTVEIPELSIGDDVDSQTMLGAFKRANNRVQEYTRDEIVACDRIGMRGAVAIMLAEGKRQILPYPGAETMYFSHAPICAFFALHLAGNSPQARELVLNTPCGEGDRFVVEDSTLTLVPLD